MNDDSIIYESEFETKPMCESGDWNCLWNNFYKGYLIFVEAVIPNGVDSDNNPTYKVVGVDVTGLSNDDINSIIDGFKKLYLNAENIRVHFCGNHLGKPCKFFIV